MLHVGQFFKLISVLAKGGGKNKKFQYCLNPNYHLFMYRRAFARQCIPEGFTEYFYHVGNGKELRSIVYHGLIPGGVSLRTGRQVVFFAVVNPMMDNQDGLR